MSDTSIHLAANAETQALRHYATHKDLRIIYTVAEIAYRLIANKKDITSPADLKGKRIGTFPSTSAAHFVEKLLASAGLGASGYSVVSGSICSAHLAVLERSRICFSTDLSTQSGCGDQLYNLPSTRLERPIWRYSKIRQTIYREIFNLHSTATKHKDAATRKGIIALLKALNQALNIYNTDPSSIFSQVSSAVGVSAAVLKEVWPVHSFNGTILAPDVLDFLVQEDAWVAQRDRRNAMTKEELTNLIDPSVLAEALES